MIFFYLVSFWLYQDLSENLGRAKRTKLSWSRNFNLKGAVGSQLGMFLCVSWRFVLILKAWKQTQVQDAMKSDFLAVVRRLLDGFTESHTGSSCWYQHYYYLSQLTFAAHIHLCYLLFINNLISETNSWINVLIMRRNENGFISPPLSIMEKQRKFVFVWLLNSPQQSVKILKK